MADGNWRAAKMQAYAYLRDLERPPSISPRQWVGVKALLYVVARGQPRMYWGQEKIAQRMGVTDRAVRNYIRWACDAGLLTVWINAGVSRRGNPSKTSQYHLTELLAVPEQSSAAVPEQSSGKGSGEPDGSPDQAVRDTPCPELRSEHSVSLRPPAGPQPNLLSVSQRGKLSASEALARANDSGHIRRRPRAKDPDASRRLVNYFLDRWEQTNSDRDCRVADTIGSATGYVRSTFISPSAGRKYTEDEVRAFIDQFMEAVHRRTVMIKPNQSAFMAFTGWWGRAGKVYRHDPGANRRFFEEEQRRLLTQERPPA